MIANLKRIGLLSLFFVFFINLISIIFFMFGGRIHWGIVILSLFMAVAATFYVVKPEKNDKMDFVICVGIFILFSIGAMICCSIIFSSDWDGNTYHKMAIGLLKNGWNPIAESASEFAAEFFNNGDIPSHNIWTDHYGKASWIYAAAIYSLTGSIEAGKSYLALGMLALFCLLLAYLLERGISEAKAIVISVIFTFNPISISQLLTYYVDGYLFVYLFVLIVGLLEFIEQKNKILSWAIVFTAMPVLANIKFTGLLYGGIFCVFFYVFYIGIQYVRNRELIKKEIISKLVVFSILAVVSVGLLGFPTYVKNFMEHSSPVYPLSDPDVDIMTANSPAGFENKTVFYKLFYAIFCQADNIVQSNAEKTLPELKIPFMVYPQEIEKMGSADLRCSGFGLFFSGILIVSAGVIIFFLLVKKCEKIKKVFICSVLGLLLILTFAISESWWARYSPHLYLIPCIAVVMLLLLDLKKWTKIFAYIIVLILMFNNFIFFCSPIERVKASCQINNTLDSLAGKEIDVELTDEFSGLLFNLEDKEVTYNVVKQKLEKWDGFVYRGVKWKAK